MNGKCIDAGREGCPCALAEHGTCPVCSRLRGGTCEACAWQGICIGLLYHQNGRRPVAGRRQQLLSVAEVKHYSDDFKVFLLRASKGFCQKAGTAGAYVFVRAEGEAGWYDAPVSVLKAEPEKGLLHLGILRCGAKTGSIFQAAESARKGPPGQKALAGQIGKAGQIEQPAPPGRSGVSESPGQTDRTERTERQGQTTPQKLWVRGVYYNALQGLGGLNESGASALVYAKGIAMAPLRNLLDGGRRYTKWLSGLQVFADLDKVGCDFFFDYFGDLPAERVEVCRFAEDGAWVPKPGSAPLNVFILTSPFYADSIEAVLGRKAVRPTEGNMCCGEGVCGACTYVDALGRTVRRCKASR